jgi:DNA-binding CsgD family transcriptional regulator
MKKEYTFSEALHHAILSGLDLLPIAFLVLDGNGRTLVANRAARRAMQKDRIVRGVDHVLSLQPRLHNKALREMIAPTGDSVERAPAALTVPRPSGKPLSILVVPINSGEPNDSMLPGSLVFLGDPELPVEPDQGLLAKLFGFTPAESKVASLVMQGNTVEEVAAKLHISPHTTRNHLKRLFSKTNTKRQGELVHMLLSSPACLNFTL